MRGLSLHGNFLEFEMILFRELTAVDQVTFVGKPVRGACLSGLGVT